jgi:hypothetical protein
MYKFLMGISTFKDIGESPTNNINGQCQVLFLAIFAIYGVYQKAEGQAQDLPIHLITTITAYRTCLI